ncbi:MAG: type II toxin-antitoxin system VapC family toxin [Burkholderiales bacterium]|nr:type II toxin-antitoxin system VapC family toxin [Burkholderiales bacterium]
MSGNIVDASRYAFSDKDRILVDANVWLYLFAPNPPGSPAVRSYSAVFTSIQKGQGKLYLDVLVLSEFVNRYARLEHQIQKGTGAAVSHDFKTFRDSADFVPIAQAIQASVMKIGRYAQLIDHPLTAFDLPAVLTEFATGRRDINDELLAQCCNRHGLMLLTNDADLVHTGITILTTNPQLLRRR